VVVPVARSAQGTAAFGTHSCDSTSTKTPEPLRVSTTMEREILIQFVNWIIANDMQIIPQPGEDGGVSLGAHLIVSFEPYTVEDFVDEYIGSKK
jgi:hypothetical protein